MVATDIVLVVDDDEMVRATYDLALRHDGWQTVLADSATAALEQLDRTEGISVMLTDLTMPGTLDGGDLVHLVRARRPTVGIVLTTGHQVAPGSFGPDVPVLLKPFGLDQLLDTVRRAQPGSATA